MDRPLLNLITLCTITFGIILFCIIAGGYSSFSRSQSRIAEARSFLTDACEKRLILFNDLIESSRKTSIPISENPDKKTIKKAQIILQQVISHEPPVDGALIKEFEQTQTLITRQMISFLHQLEAAPATAASEQILSLKKELNLVQDAVFVARKQYNNETRYFNSRIKMFPGFLIAKLFGLNHIEYTEISENIFLSGEKTFTSTAS